MHATLRLRSPLTLAAFLMAGSLLAAPSPFVDLDEGHWAAPAVRSVVEAGLLEGYGGRFHGDRAVDRYQLAVVLERLLEVEVAAHEELREEGGEERAPRPAATLGAPASASDTAVAALADEVAWLRQELGATRSQLRQQRDEYAAVRQLFTESRFKPW